MRELERIEQEQARQDLMKGAEDYAEAVIRIDRKLRAEKMNAFTRHMVIEEWLRYWRTVGSDD